MAEARTPEGADQWNRAVTMQRVIAELDRQHQKWGEQNHPDGTGPFMYPLHGLLRSGDQLFGPPAEALADRAKRATDNSARLDAVTWREILLEELFEAVAESDQDALTTELIQTAAVCVQWIVAIERRNRRG